MTEPQSEHGTFISARQHYFDLTVVYCLVLIVLTQVPWPEDPARRLGIDLIGFVLLALAVLSFLQSRRARAKEKSLTQ